MKLFKKAKKGFTLVELVVVIAVIAILAAVSVGAYFGVTASANNSSAQQEAKALHTNLVLIANDPNNNVGVTFTKTGIQTSASTTTVGLIGALEDASGINLKGGTVADGTETLPEVTFVDYTDDDVEVIAKFTYKSTKNVTVTVDIATGNFDSTVAA